jgi:glycosyltransferase involved in cell wall biosynthesis
VPPSEIRNLCVPNKNLQVQHLFDNMVNKLMNILSVYYKHKKGGFNKRLYQIYLALVARKHTVHYIAAEAFPIAHPHIFAHIIRIPFCRRESFLFWILFVLSVPCYSVWIARKNHIQRIVVFSAFYAAICCLAVSVMRIKMITFLRADVLREARFAHKSRLKIRLHRIFEFIGLRFSALVVANSNSLKHSVSSRRQGLHWAVLPNNVQQQVHIGNAEKLQIRRAHNLPPDGFVVATAAPLSRVKNIDFLLEAFSKLALDSARLLIIGDDLNNTGERKRLEALAERWQIDTQTVFTGWLDNPLRTIAAADLFVFPSSQEGSPNALLEALACNIPCMGSRIPEIGEILHNEELQFGLDSTEELTCKIRRTGTDPTYAQHLKQLSDRCKQAFIFDWDNEAVRIITEASCRRDASAYKMSGGDASARESVK